MENVKRYDIMERPLIINKNKQNQVDSGGQIPSGHGGPRPSGDSVALPPISAGYSDCKQARYSCYHQLILGQQREQ